MTNNEQEIWRAVRVVFVLMLLCGGMALGAEPEVAEAAADGAAWLPVAYAVGGGTLGGGGMWIFNKLHRVQIEPQPLEVKTHKEYATRAELHELRKCVYEDLDKANRRIDTVATSAARVEGKLDTISMAQQQILKILMKRES